MGKSRYRWWGYVKRVVRDYPEMKERHDEARRPSIASRISAAPSGGGMSNPTYIVATGGMEPQDEREYEAVRRALDTTERYSNGCHRVQLISDTYWNKECGELRYAALRVPCAEITAKRWHGDFIRLVASYLGLLE